MTMFLSLKSTVTVPLFPENKRPCSTKPLPTPHTLSKIPLGWPTEGVPQGDWLIIMIGYLDRKSDDFSCPRFCPTLYIEGKTNDF